MACHSSQFCICMSDSLKKVWSVGSLWPIYVRIVILYTVCIIIKHCHDLINYYIFFNSLSPCSSPMNPQGFANPSLYDR